MTVLMLIGRTSDNISHLAHLGGFIGGYIIMKIFFRGNLPWDPLRFIKLPSAPKFTPPPVNPSGSQSGHGGKDANAPVTQRELDALLDKLSRDGINSLSEYELQRLKKARRQMRGED